MVLSQCKGMHLHCSQRVAAVRCQHSVLQAPKRQLKNPHESNSNGSRISHVCFAGAVAEVKPEAAIPGMAEYLDKLRWSADGLVPVIVQVNKHEM